MSKETIEEKKDTKLDEGKVNPDETKDTKEPDAATSKSEDKPKPEETKSDEKPKDSKVAEGEDAKNKDVEPKVDEGTKVDDEGDDGADDGWNFAFPEDDKEKTVEDKKKESETDEQWGVYAKKLGINAENEDDFLKKAKEKLDNPVVVTGNEEIDNLRGYLGLSDKELVSEIYKQDNIEENDIKDSIESKSDVELRIEAARYRNEIKRTMQSYSDNALQRQDAHNAKQDGEIVQRKSDIRDYLSKTSEVLGIKIGKNDAEVQRIRDNHYEYITSGKFATELVSSPENEVTCAWLFRNRDSLVKILEGRGINKGKKKMLDDTTNANPEGSRSTVSVSSSEEFDVKKFAKNPVLTPAEQKTFRGK